MEPLLHRLYGVDAPGDIPLLRGVARNLFRRVQESGFRHQRTPYRHRAQRKAWGKVPKTRKIYL